MRRIVSHTVTSILITSWPVFSSSTFKSKRFITPRTSGNNGPIYDYIPLSELQLCAQCVLKVNGVSRRFFPAKREAPQNYAQLKKCYNIIISWFGGYNIYDLFFFSLFSCSASSALACSMIQPTIHVWESSYRRAPSHWDTPHSPLFWSSAQHTCWARSFGMRKWIVCAERCLLTNH